MRKVTQLSLVIGSALAVSVALAQQPDDDRTTGARAAAESTDAARASTAQEADKRMSAETDPDFIEEDDEIATPTAPTSARRSASAEGAAQTETQATQTGSQSTSASRSTDAARSAQQTQQQTDRSQAGSAETSRQDAGQANAQDSAAGSATRQAQAGRAVAIPVITVLVPVGMESQTDTRLANGCWAKLYGQTGFRGDNLTLVGPVDMPDMQGPFGFNWNDKVSSIKAGPNATVVIYDNPGFKDKAATVKAGQQVNEISTKMGFFEEVESIKVQCNRGGAASGGGASETTGGANESAGARGSDAATTRPRG